MLFPNPDVNNQGGGDAGFGRIPGINTNVSGNNTSLNLTDSNNVKINRTVDLTNFNIPTGTGTSDIPVNVDTPGLDSNLSNIPVVNTSTGTGTGTDGTGTSNFPANTGGTGLPGTGVNTLNPATLLGFNNTNSAQLISQLDSLFGKGIGQVFYNFLSSGAGYSPDAATALANANLPYEERSRNNILESFGASGGRYGSPAAIGLGDFESSYALGQQSIFANEYDKAVDRYSRMFGGILDTAHLEQANKLGIKDILGGLLSALGGGGAGGNISSIIKTIKDAIQGNGPGFPGTKPGTGPANGDGTGSKGTNNTGGTGLPGHSGWIQDSNGLWMSPDQWANAGFQDPNGQFNWDAFYNWAGESGYSSGNGSLGDSSGDFMNSDGSINWDNIYGYDTGSGSTGGSTGSESGDDWSWLWNDYPGAESTDTGGGE